MAVTEKPDEAKKLSASHSSKKKDSAKFALIKVHNTLLNRNAPFQSGAVTYENLQRQLLDIAESGQKNVLFDFHSLGGEAMGMFNLAEAMKQLKQQYGLNYVGLVDGYCCSAAYGIASQCDKIVATQDSVVGSVAAFQLHVDATKQAKKRGLKYTILRSKDWKARGGSLEALDPETEGRMRAALQKLDTRFNILVTANRTTLPLQAVIDAKGKSMDTDEALKLGFIDGVLQYKDIAHLDALFTNPKEDFSMTKKELKQFKALASAVKAQATALEQLQTQMTELASTLKNASASGDSDSQVVDPATDPQAADPQAADPADLDPAAKDTIAIMKLGNQLGLSDKALELAATGKDFATAKELLLAEYKAATGKEAIFQESGELQMLSDDDLLDLAEV